MVQHWRVVQAEAKETKSEETSKLLKWLRGKWRDQKDSIYEVSVDELNDVSVITTRPSGEVIRTNGLIRVDASKSGRVVWGKVGARFLYVLEKQGNNSLRWRSGGTGNFFDWERQDGFVGEDTEGSKIEREVFLAIRCAQVRRESRQCRDSTTASKDLLGLRCEAKKSSSNLVSGSESECESRQCLDAAEALKDLLGLGRKAEKSLADLLSISDAAKSLVEDAGPEPEKDVVGTLIECLTSSADAEVRPCLTPLREGFHFYWHEAMLLQALQFPVCESGMWNPMTPYDLGAMAVWASAGQAYSLGGVDLRAQAPLPVR